MKLRSLAVLALALAPSCGEPAASPDPVAAETSRVEVEAPFATGSDRAEEVVKAAPEDTVAPVEIAPAPPLSGLYEGKVTTFRQADGFFSFEMPRGWSAEEQAGVVAINPGLSEGDTLDAMILVTYGELSEDERGTPLERILADKEAELRTSFAEQQVTLAKAAQAPRRITIDGLAGAEQEWRGEAGGHAVQLWLGAIVQREYYFGVVALVVEGREERFLPGARRMLASVKPKAPVRDREAEAELAGLEFARTTSFGGGGSMHTVYEFGSGGTVARRTMTSGSFGIDGSVGGESVARGTYMVVGPLAYLQFSDGQEVARVSREGRRVSALRLGNQLYPRL